MKHSGKILAITLAIMMTLMAAVPYQTDWGYTYAGTEKATEESAEAKTETKADSNADAQDVEASSEQAENNDEENLDDETADEADDVVYEEEIVEEEVVEEEQPVDKDSAGDGEKATEKSEEVVTGLVYEGEDFDVTIDSGVEANLPDDTELSVGEITNEDDQYDKYYKAAVKALQKDADKKDTRAVRFVRLYDFALTSGGEIIEPEAGVNVTIDYSKAVEAEKAIAAENPKNIQIIHFTKSRFLKRLQAEILEDIGATVDGSALTEASFAAESFSVYAVAYTVDFHYGDGEYDFSIEGESNIMLSDVLERLHIGDLTVNDIQAVEFSDPELVKVEAEENQAEDGTGTLVDWKLTSLKAFDTEETLTLTLCDGSSVVIDVTDQAVTADDREVDGVRYTYHTNGTAVVNKIISYPATVHDQIIHNGTTYEVKDIHAADQTVLGREVRLDDDMARKLIGMSETGITLPTITDGYSGPDIDEYLTGNKNTADDEQNQIFKKADYSNGKLNITLGFYRKIQKNKPITFIVVDDESATNHGDRNMGGYIASKVLFQKAYIHMLINAVLEKQSEGYDIDIALVPLAVDHRTDTARYIMGAATKEEALTNLYSNYSNGHSYHGAGCRAAKIVADDVISKGGLPVVIYMSDFGSYADDEDVVAPANALKEVAEVFTIATDGSTSHMEYIPSSDNNGKRHQYVTSSSAEVVTAVEEIVKFSTGYYVERDTIATDVMSDELSNASSSVSLPSGGDGSLSRTGKNINWTLAPNDGGYYEANHLYTQTITIDLNENSVYSGSMPTNERYFVGDNVITQSPKLKKDLTIITKCDKNNTVIKTASFELKDSSGTVLWSGTADSNGKVTIPWAEADGSGKVSFAPGSTYTLIQTATDGKHLTPNGTWTLTVGNDYKITATGHEGSDPDRQWMVTRTSVENGSLVVYNMPFTILSIVNNMEEDIDLTDIKFRTSLDDDAVSIASISNAYLEETTDPSSGDTTVTYTPIGAVPEKVTAGETVKIMFSGYSSAYYEIDGGIDTMFTVDVNLSDSGDFQLTDTPTTDANSRVKGTVSDFTAWGSMSGEGGSTATFGDIVSTPAAYIRIQNQTKQELTFRLFVGENGEYHKHILKKGSGNQHPIDPVHTDHDGYYYEFTMAASEGVTKSETLMLPSAGGLKYSVKVYKNVDGTLTDITDNLFDYQIKLNDKAGNPSDPATGILVNGPTYTGREIFDTVLSDRTKYTNVCYVVGAVPITITKAVDGEYADITKSYEFMLTVEGAADGASYKKVGEEGTVANNGTFSLSNSESITLYLPIDKEITLTENDASFYTITATSENGLSSGPDVNNTDKTIKFKISNSTSAADVTITNTSGEVVPSGLKAANNMLAVLLVLAGAASYVYFIIRRRRRA